MTWSSFAANFYQQHPELVEPENYMTTSNYTTLKPSDALAHLSEKLTEEVERFEKDTGLRLASVKPKREKETDVLLKLNVTVR